MVEPIYGSRKPSLCIDPSKTTQLVRYYGVYSNVSRGKKTKEKLGGEEEMNWKPEIIEIDPPPVSKELKKRWSYFIRKVYETDPHQFS